MRRLPQVHIVERRPVAGLVTAGSGGRVAGVRVHEPGGLADLTADLVVDATGRGSRIPQWLSELGYRPPAEDRAEIGLGTRPGTSACGPAR